MLILQDIFGYDVIFTSISAILLFAGVLLLLTSLGWYLGERKHLRTSRCVYGWGYSAGWEDARAPFERKRDPRTGRITGI